jgi:hypothetical protein
MGFEEFGLEAERSPVVRSALQAISDTRDCARNKRRENFALALRVGDNRSPPTFLG